MPQNHLVSERAEIAFTFWFTMFLAFLLTASLAWMSFRINKLEELHEQRYGESK